MSISFAPSCIMRCASAGVTDVIVIGSVLLAVELIERGEQHLGPGVSDPVPERLALATRSEEHTSELQSLMRISYAVFCLKKKINDYIEISHRYIRKTKTNKARAHIR